MKFKKKYIKYLVIITVLLLGSIFTQKTYQNHIDSNRKRMKENHISWCNGVIKDTEEIQYSINQIALYIRQINASENDLRTYRDMLDRTAKKINQDLYLSRKNPMAVCITITDSYDDLHKILKTCQTDLRETYRSMLKSSASCRSSSLKYDLEALTHKSKALEESARNILR